MKPLVCSEPARAETPISVLQQKIMPRGHNSPTLSAESEPAGLRIACIRARANRRLSDETDPCSEILADAAGALQLRAEWALNRVTFWGGCGTLGRWSYSS
jgi:hypothetical protein